MELTHQQHTVKTSARHNIYTSHINKYTTTGTVHTLTITVHRVQVTRLPTHVILTRTCPVENYSTVVETDFCLNENLEDYHAHAAVIVVVKNDRYTATMHVTVQV